jgi:hypothetical protein
LWVLERINLLAVQAFKGGNLLVLNRQNARLSALGTRRSRLIGHRRSQDENTSVPPVYQSLELSRRARKIIQPLREKQALISTRTRQALSAAKAGGVSLGNPKLHEARKNAVGAVKAEADRYAANVLPIIREAQKAGARTLREIAEALNARGIATARGGQWYAQSVANILERA